MPEELIETMKRGEGIHISTFVIDDDKDMVDLIGLILKDNGVDDITLFTDPNFLLASIHKNVHICIVDYLLTSEMTGLDLIKRIVQINPYCYFIMLSNQDDKSVVIELMNSTWGSRYIPKDDPELQNKLLKIHNAISEHIHLISGIFGSIYKLKDSLKDLKENAATK